MDFSKVFGPDVSIRDFFFEHVPHLYEERGDEYRDYASEDLIFSVLLKDTGERYSVAIGADSVEVEDEEMIDFPVVTLVGYDKFWPQVREQLARLSGTVDERRHEYQGKFHVTRAFLDDFERFDAAIDIELFDDESDESVEMALILNDYDDGSGFRRFAVRIPLSMIESVATGEVSIVEAAKRLTIRGDMALALELGGLFLTHADA